ncbi:MAG: PaaI family thioesterase [Pseudolabrys sp.]|nr:PaaI family thioesterase [Pseudolabrys sp.]MBV9955372.1 PaaI family thioesterase [Pseudolabrys sp.]
MSKPAKSPAMSREQIEALLAKEFPQAFHPGSGLSVEEVGFGTARVRQAYMARLIRPGGTISGPTMMALADFAMYVAVFSAAGPVPLAVTTNLNINFLRKPAQADIVAKARLLKHGKRLVVGEVDIVSADSEETVAHVTATYSIPPAT